MAKARDQLPLVDLVDDCLELPRTYSVNPSDREPLLRFMLDALRASGCKILKHSGPARAPFRIAFETVAGERMGIVAYAFFAGCNSGTAGRPADEHSFQVKYGSKDGQLHPIWVDPYGLHTTLFCGIDPERGLFVGADPQAHNPTKFFIRLEYKQRHVDAILRDGWHAWERERRVTGAGEPVEVLIGGTASSFLRFVRFEREAAGLDPGHRQLLAEKLPRIVVSAGLPLNGDGYAVPATVRHRLAEELELSEGEVLDLIGQHRRLKMAVRGWVAEEHLVRTLQVVDGISDCLRLDEEGGPDVSLRFKGSRPLLLECKNVLRQTSADGTPRVDFQKTRASKDDACSRFYRPEQFDVVAACLHAVTEKWEFRYVLPTRLPRHPKCIGRIAPAVRVGDGWTADVVSILADAASL